MCKAHLDLINPYSFVVYKLDTTDSITIPGLEQKLIYK